MNCPQITRKYILGIIIATAIIGAVVQWKTDVLYGYNNEKTYTLIQLPNYSSIYNSTCHTIHIAMVLSGYTESWNVYLALKSILMHRSTKLHFHFIAENRSKTVLEAMLSSWLVPGITHDYYALDEASKVIKRKIAPLPSSDCFGTLPIKLNLHLVLPDSVRHVIVVEPMSVVNADLLDFWAVTVAAADHMITLCNEKCVCYCHRNTTVVRNDDYLLWGAMGLNLDRIRSSSKAKWWTQAVKNVSLCASKALDNVYKVTKINIGTSYNQEMCKLVQEYDGNQLRYREVKRCTEQLKPMIEEPPNAETSYCDLFTWERETRRRELPFLLGRSFKPSDEYDVTVVNHVNYDRLNLIERSLTNWDGPVSIAILVTELQAPKVIDFILNSSILRDRKKLCFHLLFSIGPSYPFNALRSLAHRYVSTPYVFFCDIDFVSSYGMYTAMKQHLKNIRNMDKIALVIPAFESSNTAFTIPQNKSEMLELLSQERVWPVHQKKYFRGHEPTNFTKWKIATEPYYAYYDDMFEPYCLLPTSVFSFDTRFVARFHDKASHNTQLHMAGYKFLVLHDCFIIHLPHKSCRDNKNKLLQCSKQWYTDWIKEKRKQYHYTGNDVVDAM